MRGQTKLFKSVGVPTTCPVVTSGHSEKRGSFLNQKANWISSGQPVYPVIFLFTSSFERIL